MPGSVAPWPDLSYREAVEIFRWRRRDACAPLEAFDLLPPTAEMTRCFMHAIGDSSVRLQASEVCITTREILSCLLDHLLLKCELANTMGDAKRVATRQALCRMLNIVRDTLCLRAIATDGHCAAELIDAVASQQRPIIGNGCFYQLFKSPNESFWQRHDSMQISRCELDEVKKSLLCLELDVARAVPFAGLRYLESLFGAEARVFGAGV